MVGDTAVGLRCRECTLEAKLGTQSESVSGVNYGQDVLRYGGLNQFTLLLWTVLHQRASSTGRTSSARDPVLCTGRQLWAIQNLSATKPELRKIYEVEFRSFFQEM